MLKIRELAKKRPTSKSRKRKTTSKRKSKRKPFGGYAIKFSGRQETLEEVFGKKPITPSEMTKKIWAFVKSKRISTK